jgi:hypothetical protein
MLSVSEVWKCKLYLRFTANHEYGTNTEKVGLYRTCPSPAFQARLGVPCSGRSPAAFRISRLRFAFSRLRFAWVSPGVVCGTER